MSVSSKVKGLKFVEKYDISDPNAKTLVEDILRKLNIKEPTLYSQLPASIYPRENGFIKGVKLRLNDDDESEVPPPPPVLSIHQDDLEVPEDELIKGSEPVEHIQTLYQLKEESRIANNKVAEMYKTLGQIKTVKKEHFTDWFKNTIWRKNNGSLEKRMCPVCSLNIISIESFSAGHILPESKGGMMCLENIMPICPECNSQMGSRHLYWFAWHYYGKVMWNIY